MELSGRGEGTVYTETVVHSAPEQFVSDVPYQIAIVDLEGGQRLTVRILGKEPGDRAEIGERVLFVEERQGTFYYRKAPGPSRQQ